MLMTKCRTLLLRSIPAYKIASGTDGKEVGISTLGDISALTIYSLLYARFKIYLHMKPGFAVRNYRYRRSPAADNE